MGKWLVSSVFLLSLTPWKADSCKPKFVIQEGQNVIAGVEQTIRFGVDFRNSQCPESVTKTTVVLKTVGGTDDRRAICQADLDPTTEARYCNRTCSRTPRGLDCALTLVFYRTTSRWMLSVIDGVPIPDQQFYVSVTYPPSLHQFMALPDTQDGPIDTSKHGEVLLKCDWTAGNIRRAVTIYNSHKEMLNTSLPEQDDRAGQLTYRIRPVTCGSSGVYTCQVEGEPRALSVTLLVQCPPIIEETVVRKEVVAGRNVELNLAVQSHTANLTCTLRPPQTTAADCNNSAVPLTCHKNVEVKGEPPDLNLTLRLESVTKCDAGNWSLSIGNDFNGQANSLPNTAVAQVHIDVLSSTVKADLELDVPFNMSHMTGRGVFPSKGLPVNTIIAASVSAIIISLIIIVIYVRNCQNKMYKDQTIVKGMHNGEESHSTKNEEIDQDDGVVYCNIQVNQLQIGKPVLSKKAVEISQNGKQTMNDEGLIYGQLDFSKITPRKSAPTPQVQTDYADILFYQQQQQSVECI